MVLTERKFPAVTALASRIAWVKHEDVAASQLILATIAGSMMTTVSVVFSVLIMALSLASLQFSPRILRGFMGDRPTQNTLGVFVGTFLYSLLVLRTIQGGTEPFVPAASVSVAMLLAAGALVWLVYFIHHIAHGIHANHIVERIGNETIEIIDEEFPVTVGRADTHPQDTGPPAPPPADAAPVESVGSGYIQLINRERLLELARQHGLTIYQQHGIGEFAVEGNPLGSIVPPDRITDELKEAVVECFDKYGRGDMSVSLRMLRALSEIAMATDHPPHQERALYHARLVQSGLTPQFLVEDREELVHRLRMLEDHVAAARPSAGRRVS